MKKKSCNKISPSHISNQTKSHISRFLPCLNKSQNTVSLHSLSPNIFLTLQTLKPLTQTHIRLPYILVHSVQIRSTKKGFGSWCISYSKGVFLVVLRLAYSVLDPGFSFSVSRILGNPSIPCSIRI